MKNNIDVIEKNRSADNSLGGFGSYNHHNDAEKYVYRNNIIIMAIMTT